MPRSADSVLLELKGVSKRFPGVKALSGVSMALRKGEVHALVGENGAGKSTLMKILSGAYRKDEGEILMDGKEVLIDSPKAAEALGISIIYQELNLMNGLTVAENIFLGRHPKRRGFVSWERIYRRAGELMDRLGLKINVRSRVGALSLAQRQMVEIAKAVSRDARVVIMDEPTSSLTAQEIRILFDIIGRLKREGVAVVFISHRMDEIFAISDRLTVLRDGCCIGTKPTPEVSRDQLIAMMIGRQLTQQYPERKVKAGEVLLEVEGLSGLGKIRDVSFHVRCGEVMGLAGLVGSGRTEVMRLLFGADKKSAGRVLLEGREVRIRSPRDSIRAKIAFVTEDRKGEGLFLPYPLTFNTTIVAKKKIKRARVLNRRVEREVTRRYVDELHIATPSELQKAVLLSGGNQQKVVLAKWLFSDSRVIIMDEPTRGIDVGAKREIYEIINRLAAEGKAILVVSSELEEIMGICDRILVMREGAVAGSVEKHEFSQQTITELALGARA